MPAGKWEMENGSKEGSPFQPAIPPFRQYPDHDAANCQSPCKQRQQNLVNWVKCSAEIESKSIAANMGGEMGVKGRAKCNKYLKFRLLPGHYLSIYANSQRTFYQ